MVKCYLSRIMGEKRFDLGQGGWQHGIVLSGWAENDDHKR